MTWRAIIWVQHLLGSGHLQRALRLASALHSHGMEVGVLSGGMPTSLALPGGIEFLQLPGLFTRSGDFSTLITADGKRVDDHYWSARQVQIDSVVKRMCPHLMISEMFPFGRSAFADEIERLVRGIRTNRADALIASSVRDILVARTMPQAIRMRDRFNAGFDLALIHSDENIIRFEDSFSEAYNLAKPIFYTGFVTGKSTPMEQAQAPTREPAGAPLVLVSAGGGAVGRDLLLIAATLAKIRASESEPWQLIAGANADDEFYGNLKRLEHSWLKVDRHRHDFLDLLQEASVSISQAGYNTVIEALAAQTPMVLVPYSEAGETEQTRRAEILADRGMAIHLPETQLREDSLARAIEAAHGLNKPGFVNFRGAENAASKLEEQLNARFPEPA